MPNTPVLGLPYPTSADTADVPRDIKALADSLDIQQIYVPVGGLILWPLIGVPAGNLPSGKAAWLICNGQVVTATDYPKLAALLGAPGGNITIPNLADRVPVGASGTKPVGSTGGEEKHVITAAELPAHTHPDNISYAAAGAHSHGAFYAGNEFIIVDRPTAGTYSTLPASGTPAGRQLIGENLSSPLVRSEQQTAAVAAHAHTKTGGVQATAAPTQQTNVMQPYLSLNYVMRAA